MNGIECALIGRLAVDPEPRTSASGNKPAKPKAAARRDWQAPGLTDTRPASGAPVDAEIPF